MAVPASLFVHLVLIGGAVAGAAWQTAFPVDPPRIVASYLLAGPPPPPPPPPAPPPPRGVVRPSTPREVEVVPDSFAPEIIPDEIPIVPQPVPETGADSGVEGGVEGGIEGGEIGGIVGGVVGSLHTEGVGDGVGSRETAGPRRVVVPRDEKLRMYPLSMVYPIYPERARLARLEDDLVVRYVIGVNGRVRDVSVIRRPMHPIFEEATLHAIRHWRFRPMIREGEAVEVVHELTVFFRLTEEEESPSEP